MHVYFRLIKVYFPFTNGEGERRKLSFPSTVDFRLRSTTSRTHFDPHNIHSLRHMTQRMSEKLLFFGHLSSKRTKIQTAETNMTKQRMF